MLKRKILATAVVTTIGFGGFGTANAHSPQQSYEGGCEASESQGKGHGHSKHHDKHQGHGKGHGKHRAETPAPAPETPEPAPQPEPEAAPVEQAPEPVVETPVTEPAPAPAPEGELEVIPAAEEVEVIEEAPAPAPAPAPATGEVTGGTGGAAGDQFNVSFTGSNGLTSEYHIYVPADQGTAPGLLMYTDGTGGHGYHNPNQAYLLGGDAGMAAIAEAQNMILVVPLAPGSDNVWYDGQGAAKAQWSSDLMTHIKGQYNVNQDRIAIGGYSSGAQWTTQFFLPAYGEAQSVDLAVPIAYGGAPRVDASFSPEYAAATDVVFNTGTNDPGAYEAAQAGERYYSGAGFNVDATYPQGVTHSRGGEFGGIVNEAITKYIP